jgi:hypothetical protein
MDNQLEQADWVRSITASIKELQQGVNVHCCLVASILGISANLREWVGGGIFKEFCL